MTSPATPPDPNASKLLRGGRYTLVRKLGEGSQGETYEAIDHGVGPEARKRAARAAPLVDKWARYVREQRSGGEVPQDARLVAIKCFRVGNAKAWKDVELAEREASTLASLDHPHLPKYVEHFEEDGALYLVMEKIEGESLASLRKGNTGDERRRRHADARGRRRRAPLPARARAAGRPPRHQARQRHPPARRLVRVRRLRRRARPPEGRRAGAPSSARSATWRPSSSRGAPPPCPTCTASARPRSRCSRGASPRTLPHEGLGIDVARALPRGMPQSLVRALEAMLEPDPDRRAESVDAALAILRGEAPRDDDEGEADDARDAPSEPRPRLNRKQQRALARQRDKQRALERREKKKQRRASARRRRSPLLPRMLGRLGLFVALLAVWMIVGFAIPVVLILLSLLFGATLRRAAASCVEAARRSQAAIGRASMWLSGRQEEPGARAPREEDAARVRIAAGSERVRAAIEENVEAPAEGADAWMEERLEKEAQRERMRMHARAPANRDSFGRRRK